MRLFDLAFPETVAAHRAAARALRARQDEPVYYRFSYPVARWLASNCPGEVSIDWDELKDASRLDELLSLLLHPAEDEYFDSGWVSTREWLDMARGDSTDFDWLMAQLQDKRKQKVWSQLYDAADLPLAWDVSAGRFSRFRNRYPVKAIRTREQGMRKRPRRVKSEIKRPLRTTHLAPREGRRMINVAMASLAARYRETWHFNFANPREVYVADVGEGVTVAIFGLLPEHRFPLECTLGYLVLSNGVPIGYGGASVLFRQVNTGVNIFDDFRHSEAAFLWTQVMRVYHSLTGCTRFIANPYQFGGDNSEALKSGAFWFYYRLGYRPVLPGIRRLAQKEFARIRRNRAHRSDVKTLRRLASCDMHLTLPAARAGEFFDECWFETVSMLATQSLAEAGEDARSRYSALEPIIAAAQPQDWSPRDRRLARDLLRAKQGELELPYARLLARHDKLLKSLQIACRRAENS